MALYIRYPAPGTGSGGGGGGGGTSTFSGSIATLYDPVDTTLPSSAPTTIDGVVVTTGMTVLFSNLSSGNNEIYLATVSGPTIFWTVQTAFNGAAAPVAGSLVSIAQGTAFGGSIGEFNGTTWLFNNRVRYFNGTDYFEQSSLNTSTLTDNTTNGTVFSVAFAGSQNIIVEYSIIRSGVKEIGTIDLTTNGTLVAIATNGSATGATGVTFSGVISGSNLVLQYTTTSTGSDATMKYEIRRWSDTAGGPGGPPSYTGGASSTPAAGSNGDVQINSSGVLGASSNFNYDSINNFLNLGGLSISILNSTSIADNQVSPALLFANSTTYTAMIVNYSISRGTNFRTGRILVSTDGTSVSTAEDFVEQGTTGVTLSGSVSGGNVNINYTSTSTGSGGTFKYFIERWTA